MDSNLCLNGNSNMGSNSNGVVTPPPGVGALHHHQTSVQRRVGIFWDYENCAPPANVPGYIVAERIREEAHRFGPVTVFKAYLELSAANTSNKMINLRSELQSSGVSLTDCPRTSNRKEVVDKMLLVDMLTFAMDNPAPAVIVLISGDRDFVYAVSVLRHRKYDVVLIIPPQGAHVTLKHQANVVLEWKYDIFSESVRATNINGNAGGDSSSSDADAVSEDGAGVVGRPPLRMVATSPRTSVSGAPPVTPPRQPTTLLPAPEYSSLLDAATSQQVPPYSSSRLPTFGSLYHNDLTSPTPSTSSAHRRTRSMQTAPVTPTRTGPFAIPSNPFMGVVSPSQTDGVPWMYQSLVEILEEKRLLGSPRPLRSTIGTELKKKNPMLYERVGVKSFSEYVRLAEKAGIVTIGGTLNVPGAEWISLKEQYQGNVFPSAIYSELQSP